MRKAKTICILINHHDDIKLFSKDLLSKSDIFCKNFYVKLELKKLKININELNFENFHNINDNLFYNFKSNWFKDKNNKDYTFFEKKFSIGNVSKEYITRDLFTFFRNYYLYLQLKKNYHKVWISSKEADCFKKFANKSKKIFFYYNSKNNYLDFVERDTLTWFDYNLIKIKNYFHVFRFLQNIFKFFLSNKSLIFNDPTLKNFFKKKNLLILNSINIFKSFYFIKPKVTKKSLPKKFRKIIKENLLKFDLPHDFVNVFAEHIHRKLKKHLNLFNTYYSMINETINFYQPKTIIIPSLKTFQSLLAQYACINKNVNVILATDGSNLGLYNDIPFNKKFLTQNKISIMAYSLEEQKYFKKFINSKNIKLTPLPLHQYFKRDLKKKYDLIVLDYYWNFNNNSIFSKRDHSYKILLDILKTVEKTDKKKIAIKLKTSSSNSDYKDFLKRNIFKNFPKLKIDFIEGNFFEALNYSNIFIGGISTAVIETIYAKKKFIIYSPIETGYSDSFVNKHSIYIKSHQIVRNLNQLQHELKSKKKIKLKKPLTN